MQAVVQSAARESFHFAAGRSYMMRSEKREGASSSHRSPDPSKRPPRKRKRKAGFFYKLFTMILLLLVWPLGLLLLWRRKLRWSAITKLLTSIVTLAACIVLLGFALTVNTGNPNYTRVQDQINSALDAAADNLLHIGAIASDQAEIMLERMEDVADAIWESSKVDLSYGIDAGVALGQRAKHTIGGWLNALDREASGTQETIEPSAEASISPDPTAAVTPKPTAAPTPEPTEAAHPFRVKPAAEATVYYNAGGKCYHMASACGSMQTSAAHTLGETLNENNHRCSVCGTPEKSILDEEYIVWVDENGIAHLSDQCGDFAGKWSLLPAAEAVESDMLSCESCEADLYLAALASGAEIQLLPEATAEPTEQPTAEPTSEPTAEPTEQPTSAPTSEPTSALEAETAAPLTIEAVVPVSEAPVQTVSAAPAQTSSPASSAAAEATPTASAAPEAEWILPNVMLKPVAEATVYHSMEGRLYHSFNRCGSMIGGGAYNLAECAETHGRCKACGAPDAALIGTPCLWMDQNNLCHTSDACEAFVGQYRLILREDALDQGRIGCAECGGDEYLIPNTKIDFAALNGSKADPETP